MNYTTELHDLQASGSLRTLPTVDASTRINLSTNDYLGLNDRTDLIEEFLSHYSPAAGSMSAASSRLLTGNHHEYLRLEQCLTDLYDGQPALVFNCGYHANAGILPALTDKHDLIIADKLIHASLIDGMRLSEATVVRFRHNDMNHLRALLEKNRPHAANCFIVVESIYSMDGDTAPLEELVSLKREFNAMLYVDEAHGVGVRGLRGEGLLSEKGLTGQADILIGTCGKALASEGAYAITNQTLRQFLINKCRTLIFTTGLPPVNIAWTRFVIEQMQDMTALRDNLKTLSTNFATLLGTTAESQIIPFVCGQNETAISLSAKLRKAGFYVLPIRHPTVPLGQARLRFSLKASMTLDELKPIKDLLLD